MFKQVELAYDFDALAPHIDAATMETHYTKHHATYTKNFNELAGRLPELEGRCVEEILSGLEDIPEKYRSGIRNNGGGYYNHNLYFESLSPNGGGEPSGELMEQIKRDFGDFHNLRRELTKAALAQFGSGYAWLVFEPDETLSVKNTLNQDSPMFDGECTLLLPIDVWEHAYYLKYRNMRADYVESLFEVIDWDVVGKRFDRAKALDLSHA